MNEMEKVVCNFLSFYFLAKGEYLTSWLPIYSTPNGTKFAAFESPNNFFHYMELWSSIGYSSTTVREREWD
jgi:hypothetical protein